MGKIIVVASGKGGTGKTTTASNLGAALSQMGYLTVLVDMDIGLRNLDIALGLESSVVYDAVEVIEGRSTLDEVLIQHTEYENLYFIAAPQTRDAISIEEEKVTDFWERIKGRFDYCIVDAPAGIIGCGFEYACAGADAAIIVALPEITALRDADRAISILEKKSIADVRLFINRIRPELIEKGLMMNVDECMDILGIPILGIIPEDEELTASALSGELVISNEKALSGKAFSNIAKRIRGENVPIIKMEKKRRFKIFEMLYKK